MNNDKITFFVLKIVLKLQNINNKKRKLMQFDEWELKIDPPKQKSG